MSGDEGFAEGAPEESERLPAHIERVLKEIDTYANNAEQVPLQTIAAVNAATNISSVHLDDLKKETGFSQALETLGEKLTEIKRRARSTLEKILIATTLIGPTVPLQSCTPHTESKKSVETVNTASDASSTQGEKLRVRDAATAKEGMETTGQSSIDTIGDHGLYQEKLTTLRHAAQNSPREQALVVITQKDGSLLLREAPFTSAGGGSFPVVTNKNVQESTHIELVHTHPYGLTIESEDKEISRFMSHAQYMPPSMPDILSSLDGIAGTPAATPEHLSFRIIDAHGDWVYTVNSNHSFQRAFENYKKNISCTSGRKRAPYHRRRGAGH